MGWGLDLYFGFSLCTLQTFCGMEVNSQPGEATLKNSLSAGPPYRGTPAQISGGPDLQESNIFIFVIAGGTLSPTSHSPAYTHTYISVIQSISKFIMTFIYNNCNHHVGYFRFDCVPMSALLANPPHFFTTPPIL